MPVNLMDLANDFSFVIILLPHLADVRSLIGIAVIILGLDKLKKDKAS